MKEIYVQSLKDTFTTLHFLAAAGFAIAVGLYEGVIIDYTGRTYYYYYIYFIHFIYFSYFSYFIYFHLLLTL